MKFSVNQKDLYPLLQSVARSCGVRSQLPVLGNILFQVASGRLILSATNLEVGIIKSLPVEGAEEGDITVPSRTILEIISNLSGEKLSLSASADQLTVQTATFSSQINGISASEFPNIPLAGKEVIVIDPLLLSKSVPEIAFAAAVDEGRPILTGILTEIKNNQLQLVATDGFRLASKLVPVEGTEALKALIPRKTFEEILRLIAEEEVDQISISISEDQNQIVFSLGTTQLSSRLIEGQFPAWEKIIPAQSVARVVVDRSQFLKAVKLASVFARSESNIIRVENQEGKLLLSSEAKELGNQKNEIVAQSEGQAITIAFNAKYLLEALGAFNTSQAILELSGPLSAAIIKPMGEEGLQYIVMPVNLG